MPTEDIQIEDDEVIPVNEKNEDYLSDEGFTIEPLEDTPDERINRRLIVPNSPNVNRSVKLRDVFLLSGCVKSSGTLTTNSNFTSQKEIGSFDFFADELNIGNVIRLTAAGYYSTANGVDLLTLEVGWGTAPSITPVMQTVVSTAGIVTDAPWNLEFWGIITSIGGSATIASNLRCNINRVNKDQRADAATFSTIGPARLSLAATWSNNLAGNSISINTFFVEILN